MKKIVSLLVALTFVLVGSIFAQTAKDKKAIPMGAETLSSYQKARTILDRTIAAYGGLETIRSIKNFSVTMSVEQFHRNQSRKPGVSEITSGHSEIIVDFRNDRYTYNVKRGVIGGNPSEAYEIINGKEGIFVDMSRRTKRPRPPSPNWREGFTARVLPQILLLNAHTRSSGLRYVSRTLLDGRPHNVISFANVDGTVISLFIDETTNLVSKQESLTGDAVAGDSTAEVIFVSYRTEGRLTVPVETLNKLGGETIFRTRYTSVLFDVNLSDSQFKLTFEPEDQTPAPETPAVRKHAERIYTVSVSGANVLFVDFRDHIFVMEAPGGYQGSIEAIAAITRTVTNKPIRYLALTHFHDDHSSGIRPYMAGGAALVTTRGNRSYFEQMLERQLTVAPEVLLSDPKNTRIELVEKEKRIFSDGETILELHNIGPGPHAEEMLVAYFPEEKIIYQGDLLDRPANGDVPIANPTTEHFAEWLRRMPLKVEKILPVHGTVTSVIELDEAIRVRRQAQGGRP